MKKGKLGISFTTYAVIAFVLAIFGQMLIAAILLGFVLYVERDEWTGRQCMQAFFLTFASGVIGIITVAIFFFSAMGTGMSFSYGYYGGGVLAFLAMLIPAILWILVLVFEIRGLVRVIKGQEADVPLLSNWAWRAYGYVRNHQTPPPPSYGYQQQGQAQSGYTPQGGSQQAAPQAGPAQGGYPQQGTGYTAAPGYEGAQQSAPVTRPAPPPPPPVYTQPTASDNLFAAPPPPPPPAPMDSQPAGEQPPPQD